MLAPVSSRCSPLTTSKWYHSAPDAEPGQGAHVHPYGECLVFFGNDTDNPNYLGAALTIGIGREHEKHSFDAPTVVSIPKGTPHLPIICHSVEKPYRRVTIGLGVGYESRPAD